MKCLFTIYLIASCLICGCSHSVPMSFGHASGSHTSFSRVTEYWILWDEVEKAGVKSKDYVGGVMVTYDEGTENEPKFTWSDRRHKFFIDNQEISLGQKFVLYVNDENGKPIRITIPKETADELFSKKPASSPESREEFWKKLEEFWKKQVIPVVNRKESSEQSPGDDSLKAAPQE